MDQIKEKNASLVAICPEKIEVIKKIYEKQDFDFPILSDTDNRLASELGIAFNMEVDLSKLYKSWGIDLEGTQGNDKDQLPIPATFIIDQTNKIIQRFVDTDYTKRFEPVETLVYLKE